MFAGNQPRAVQSAAMVPAGALRRPSNRPGLDPGWPSSHRLCAAMPWSPCWPALIARATRMAALQDGRIGRGRRAAAASRTTCERFRPRRSSRARSGFSVRCPVQRPEVVQRFTPALGLKGVSDRGREDLHGALRGLPPAGRAGARAWAGLGRGRIAGKGKLLAPFSSRMLMLRPSAAAYVVETAGGEVLIGLLLNQNPATLALGEPNGVQMVLPRANLLRLPGADVVFDARRGWKRGFHRRTWPTCWNT